jgi:hypothetical protein
MRGGIGGGRLKRATDAKVDSAINSGGSFGNVLADS